MRSRSLSKEGPETGPISWHWLAVMRPVLSCHSEYSAPCTCWPPSAMNRLSLPWTYEYHPVLSASGEAPPFAVTVVYEMFTREPLASPQ